MGFLLQPHMIRLRVPGALQEWHCEQYRGEEARMWA